MQIRYQKIRPIRTIDRTTEPDVPSTFRYMRNSRNRSRKNARKISHISVACFRLSLKEWKNFLTRYPSSSSLILNRQ